MCESCHSALANAPTDKILKAQGAIDAILRAAGITDDWQTVLGLEARLNKVAKGEWSKLADKAVAKAVSLAKASSKPITDERANQIADAVDGILSEYGKPLEPTIQAITEDAYKVSMAGAIERAKETKRATTKASGDIEAGIEGTFDLADEDAIQALSRRHTIWIGEHYSRSLAASVRDYVRETVVRGGRDPEAVAGEMQRVLQRELLYDPATPFEGSYARIPTGWRGSTDEYFEMLSSNVATVGRVAGQLSAFSSLGAERYVIVNPLDERTCPECSDMAGQSVDAGGMEVDEAWGMQQREFRATPDAIRDTLHPWSKLDTMRTRAGVFGKWGKDGASKMIKAGYGFPPFHGRCRCFIDIVP